MATLERYSSFEEMEEAQAKENTFSKPASKKNKTSKKAFGQKLFKEFGELLRKGIVHHNAGKK